ncbi:hypothetical protein GCM10023093_16000 [Nemorincola caseinilytica]|uniref:PKD domain-containing protein n=2 Tax=Nemorincola caseinilytica TaxID=2054315 RepID=A0ABP8NC53_9BACT
MAQSPTAPALGFNVFLEGNARLVNNETEGPLACGGNLIVAGGYQVSINDPGTFYVSGVRTTLVVGGRIEYSSGTLQVNQNGYMKIGNCIGSTVWYQDPNGAYPPIRITPGSSYDGYPRIHLQASANTLGVSAAVNPICQANVIDFASAFATMRACALSMKNLTDNAYITNSGGTPIPHTGLPSQVKITLNPGLNVLNISGADFNAMSELTFINSPSASQYLVVNVNAPGSFTFNVPNINGVGLAQCKYILYNFHNTTALNIAGYGVIEGTLFAPNADITKTANMANIEGQIIAKSYHHAGGENHYAVFAPSIGGCSATTPTHASFTVNSNIQCLACNSFSFTNTSTGSGTLSYLWRFGDGTTSTSVSPSKIYTATGTYAVKLRTTGTGGSDSTTISVTVTDNPAYGFSINDSVQALTGNSFAFTSTTPTFGNTYFWIFGDGGTSAAVNPVHTYTAAGVYTVMQRVTGSGGCLISMYKTVVVESDAVGGGGGGGLESESLGDLISKREYAKIKNSVNSKPDLSTLPTFSKPGRLALAAKGSAATSSLERFIPANLDASSTPKITSPSELKNITRAVDAFAVDYMKNDISKAVVLGITTEGRVYNHTKSICDRFRGATLVSTRVVTINGYNFIEFALKQNDGHVEHSITFTLGKTANVPNFRLQAKWLISEYSGDDSVFNFQVWATSPESVEKLTKDLLDNAANIMPIQQVDASFGLPQTYMASGTRKKEFLNVNIASTRPSNNTKMIFIRRLNETANEDSLIIPFNIAAGNENDFSIPIYDGYEYEGHYYVNDTLVDDVYLADGGWSLDVDNSYTNVIKFKPDNNQGRIYSDDEFPLYRSVEVKASTNDYVSIYKFIKAGQEAADLSKYNSYKFFARGSGEMTIRLIKSSVVKFSDQYQTTVKLDPAGQNHQISFEDFTSKNLPAAFDASDVTALVYTFEMKGVPTDLSFFADEQAFSPTKVQSIKALSSKAVELFPNPVADGKFQVKFVSEEPRDMDLTVTDLTGKVMYRQTVHAIMGYNKVDVELPASVPATVMFVQLGNDQVMYGITKLGIAK